jgi:hypothetical protein
MRPELARTKQLPFTILRDCDISKAGYYARFSMGKQRKERPKGTRMLAERQCSFSYGFALWFGIERASVICRSIDRYSNVLMSSVPFRSTCLMLKNGLVIRKSEGHEAAEILCDIDEAKGLREIASRHRARQLYCRQDAGSLSGAENMDPD